MTENTNDQINPNQASGDQVQFSMQKIYVKDLSFEAPGVPETFNFQDGYRPDVNLELNTNSRSLENDLYEVTLHVTVTAKNNDTVLFLAEVKQAGVFVVANMDDANKRHTLGSFCPSVLFPYARTMVSEMITHGGFPQLLLAHINFEQLFQAQEAKRAEQAAAVQQSGEQTH